MSGPAAVIAGLGAWLPPRVVTNDDLAARLDTTDSWIRERTGIRERRRVGAGMATGDLAVEAGRLALKASGSDSADTVVLATTTPDRPCPATAPEVAARLGLSGAAAFDVSAVCTGFLYALAAAAGLVATGTAERVLLIGAEAYSTILDPDDRTTAAIFGDGAGAVVLRAGRPEEPGAVGRCVLGSDGDHSDLIRIPAGGSRQRSASGPADPQDHYFRMDGRKVYRHAVERMTAAAHQALAAAGWTADEVDRLAAHQANARITDAVAERLGVPPAAPAGEHRPGRQHGGGLGAAAARGGDRRQPAPRGRPHPARRLRRRPHLGRGHRGLAPCDRLCEHRSRSRLTRTAPGPAPRTRTDKTRETPMLLDQLKEILVTSFQADPDLVAPRGDPHRTRTRLAGPRGTLPGDREAVRGPGQRRRTRRAAAPRRDRLPHRGPHRQGRLMPRSDVVVTGLGLVTPAGIGVESSWEGICSGTPAAALDDTLAANPVRISCRVPGFDAARLLGGRLARRLDRFVQFAVVAGREAVADAGLTPAGWDGARVGVVMGCADGGPGTVEAQHQVLLAEGAQYISALLLPMQLPNMLAGQLSMEFGATGPSMVVATACASGANALGIALDLLRNGRCDVVLAGGAAKPWSPRW
ncbi:hypothetical protein GCM10020000_70760 [Streptomyces olivoverticillatus]